MTNCNSLNTPFWLMASPSTKSTKLWTGRRNHYKRRQRRRIRHPQRRLSYLITLHTVRRSRQSYNATKSLPPFPHHPLWWPYSKPTRRLDLSIARATQYTRYPVKIATTFTSDRLATLLSRESKNTRHVTASITILIPLAILSLLPPNIVTNWTIPSTGEYDHTRSCSEQDPT